MSLTRSCRVGPSDGDDTVHDRRPLIRSLTELGRRHAQTLSRTLPAVSMTVLAAGPPTDG